MEDTSQLLELDAKLAGLVDALARRDKVVPGAELWMLGNGEFKLHMAFQKVPASYRGEQEFVFLQRHPLTLDGLGLAFSEAHELIDSYPTADDAAKMAFRVALAKAIEAGKDAGIDTFLDDGAGAVVMAQLREALRMTTENILTGP